MLHNLLVVPELQGRYHLSFVQGGSGLETILVEPFDRIDLSITTPDPALSAFIAFSLESTHGDLNLLTPNLDKPPISPLGMLIRKHNGGTYAQALVETITRKAEGNIGFSRLLLELVHEACSIEEIEATAGGAGDRLPKRIIDYFDAGIGKIQERAVQPERDPGLKAISVAATCEDCCYKTFDEVKSELEEGNRSGAGQLAAVRVVDDVIRAANGFLVALKGEDHCVALYHEYFGFYVRQNYNTTLFWEHAMMKTHHKRKQSRTTEFAGMGKTNTTGAGKLLKMRKHIKAVSKLLRKKKGKLNMKEYTGFKLKRRITGMF
ncbi:hypothetical protein SLS56_003144 [Neofusicoccum ribis]|uniref:Uncharacterized protein n=1 Tax=Neofusicoccum ribis TaxID=45134 RepID=A0ABR3T0H6_9PEZI